MTYPLSRYLSITRAYHPSLSYDGRLLVFISDTAGIPQLYEMPLAADLSRPTWRNQITRGGERVLGCWFSPALGDERLIFTRDMGGDDNVQLYMIDPEESGVIHLTAGFERARHIFGDWSADGSQIIYAANRRNPATFDVYIQPIGGVARMVWRNDEAGALDSISFSPDGDRALAVRVTSAFEHQLFDIGINADTLSQLTPSGERVRFVGAVYSKDGKWVYLNTDLDSDFLYIARLNLEALEFEPLVNAAWDIEHMALSPDGKRLAYTVNVDGFSDLKVMELADGEISSAPLTDDSPGVVAKWDACLIFSPNSRHLAFSYSSAIRTSDIYIWNLENNQVHTITRSSHGSVPKRTFRAPERIRYKSFDELEIPAWFYEPERAEDEPFSAILYVDAGPDAQHRPAFNPLIQFALAQGTAVLAPNVRGSSGYGRIYCQLDDAERHMAAVTDLAHAAHWLRDKIDIDADRLAIYGENYGGFMVLAALTRYPELWAAGVAIGGIADVITFLENTGAYRRGYQEAAFGSPTRDRAFLESISPIHHMDKLAAPVMLIHGANNSLVPASEMERLGEMLKAKNLPFERMIFENEGQEIARRVNLRKAYRAIFDFLDTHLSGR